MIKDEPPLWKSGTGNDVIELRQVLELSDFPPEIQAAAAGFVALQEKAGQRSRA